MAIPPAGAGTIGLVIVQASEFDDFTRPTVVRVRGTAEAHIADITGGGLCTLVFGITIVNPGEPSPDPFAERRGNRWMYWGCETLQEQSGAALDLEWGVTLWRWDFDIKSMRKRLVEGSNLQFCFVMEPSSNASLASVSIGVSTLIKE